MLLRRRREEAEGESKMMGSGRRPLGLAGRAGTVVGAAGVGPLGRAEVRRRSDSEILRT